MLREKILKTILISDALSSPFDGLSQGHIKTFFRELNSYTDTENAIKKTMWRWKKPSLYTFVGQLSVINAVLAQNRSIDPQTLIDLVKNSPDIENYNFKFLRYPDHLSEIISSSPDLLKSSESMKIPSVFLPLFCGVLSVFISGGKISANDVFKYCITLTSDTETIVHSVFVSFTVLLSHPGFFSETLEKASAQTLEFFRLNQPFIFSCGCNPDRFITVAENLRSLMHDIINSPDRAEDIIIQTLNESSKSQITRATVNDVRTIVPFAASLVLCESKPSINTVTGAILKGGSAHPLGIYTAFLCELSSGNDIFSSNPCFINDLINKRKILDLTMKISEERSSLRDIQDFIRDEIPLTKKMLEETAARLKKVKKKVPQKSSKKETIEDRLSRHVVESWTKIDKARYRKEKSKNSTVGEMEEYFED